jgi:phosphoribosylaminoimidazole-succinocarboxamide synthase
MIVQKCEVVKIEAIVRGYITGRSSIVEESEWTIMGPR